MNAQSSLPVAIIGAGPVGLAAASHLIARGLPARLYEAGEMVAANVRSWGHVRLFSPWRFNIDPVSAALLSRHGWQEPPADVLPTGSDLVEAYLKPLAATPELSAVIETGVRIRTISRKGVGKVVSHGRGTYPFALSVECKDGGSRIDLARAVIDASGTWSNPNPMGASGIPAVGERALGEFISYGIPDILGTARGVYAGKRILVVGGGHSAANAILDLARLAEADPRLRVTWAVRSQNLDRIFGGGTADQLPARGRLGSDLKQLVGSGRLTLVTGFEAESVERQPDGVVVSGQSFDGVLALQPVDHVIAATGQRPDLDMVRELRLDLDPWLESPRLLGPMIDPNLHSCGTVPPHGYKELSHPEPDYYAVGVKSYGRAPTFLMATGYEQVRSVVAKLAGDDAAANDVRLVLPETGVCSTQFAASDNKASSCCGSAAPSPANACCN
jgi:thioredoxin reductase